jgi:lipid A 3-O-deacylase
MRLIRGQIAFSFQRAARTCCVAVLLVLSVVSPQAASAADPLAYPQPAPPLATANEPPVWSAYEFRLGALYHGIGFLGPGTESGGIDLNSEFLLPRLPFLQDTWWYRFMPRPQFGGTLNFAGKTSYVYAGLAWTWNLTPQWFIEPLTGGAIHNGELNVMDQTGRLSLGCRELFRIGMSTGYRLTDNWTAMVTWEHLSNADLCARNNGLNNLGVKFGYSF